MNVSNRFLGLKYSQSSLCALKWLMTSMQAASFTSLFAALSVFPNFHEETPDYRYSLELPEDQRKGSRE